MSENDMGCCASCFFWLSAREFYGSSAQEGDECYGMCRRYPPVFVPIDEGDEEKKTLGGFWGDLDDHYAFPVVRNHMWCGEFKSRSSK